MTIAFGPSLLFTLSLYSFNDVLTLLLSQFKVVLHLLLFIYRYFQCYGSKHNNEFNLSPSWNKGNKT